MTEHVDHLVVGLGGLGSATAYHLARRGEQVLGLDRFELGHRRGASHDSSRILRHSYHTPGYVGLTFAAYDDWAALESDTGEQLVTPTGGLDLWPPDPAIAMADYATSMTACAVPYEELDATEMQRRWPQLSLPEGTAGLYQEAAAIVPAARTVRVLQDHARAHGAQLREFSPVTAVRDRGAGGVEVVAGGSTYRCRSLVVCADAWTNQVLAGLGLRLPLTTTVEQVSYFEPRRPEEFTVGRLPLWIWMDDPSYYGFPSYGEPTVKAAQDCGGPVASPDRRSFDVDDDMRNRLAAFMATTLPASGRVQRSVRCLYTLTPDRDFVAATVPGHDAVVVGLGAAHAFKFTPTFGRLLADLAMGGTDTDLTPFRLDRPALTDPHYAPSWLV